VVWAAICTWKARGRPKPPGPDSIVLKRILTALVLIPLVLLLILRAPVPVLALVAALVALLAVQEFLALARHYSIEPFSRATYAFVGLFFLLLAISPGNDKPLLDTAIFVYVVGFAAALAPFLFLSAGMFRPQLEGIFPAAAASVFAFTYIALPLGLLVQLRQQYSGAFLLLYLMFVVWAGDIFAYFVGKSLGRHRMAPLVSPKKTWEGAAASLLASVVIGCLLYNHASAISQFLLSHGLIERNGGLFDLEKPSWIFVLALSAVLNVAAQLGDLVESVIKRGANVKDSGNLLPGHGGILDRIDALLFAAPLLWYYAAWRTLH
jgi:phosphatidate cytidylyltransferase